MRSIRVILSATLALIGIYQLYLMNIYSSPELLWSWNFLAVIGFLMGILRSKIFDSSQEDTTKATLFICILIILNIIVLGMDFSFGITDWESVLASGFVLTMMNFEESTWFLLFIIRQKPEEDVSQS